LEKVEGLDKSLYGEHHHCAKRRSPSYKKIEAWGEKNKTNGNATLTVCPFLKRIVSWVQFGKLKSMDSELYCTTVRRNSQITGKLRKAGLVWGKRRQMAQQIGFVDLVWKINMVAWFAT
jgi:hypothetical protein